MLVKVMPHLNSSTLSKELLSWKGVFPSGEEGAVKFGGGGECLANMSSKDVY